MSYPDDCRLLLRDGYAWTEMYLDVFSGRLHINGWDGESPTEWDIAHGTSHGLADIKAINELTGAVIARLEGRA